MLRQLRKLASDALKNLQSASASGDLSRSLQIGEELLIISSALPNHYHYQVAAHHYLAMTQVALGRHDRAVDQVSLMVKLAKECGDIALRSRSMITLGRVHLNFRHFDATARVWERLVIDFEEAVPKAWLLHEIGRCYFEMKRYSKALATAGRCLEYAEEGNSQKWLLHGKLLSGQALVELGRLGEAVQVLKVAARIVEYEKDSSILQYILNLINRVTRALRETFCTNDVTEKNDKFDVKALNAKSENTLSISKKIEWSSKRSKNHSTLSNAMQKSQLVVSRSCAKKLKSPKISGKKYTRKGQARKKTTVRIGNSATSCARKFGTFDHRILEDNKSLQSGISRSPRPIDFHRVADVSSRHHVRIIRNGAEKDGNSTHELKLLDTRTFAKVDQSSGVLLDMTRNVVMNDKSWPTPKDRNNKFDKGGSPDTDRTAVTYVLENSNLPEYLNDVRVNDLVTLSARSKPRDEEIDEENQNDNDEEKASGAQDSPLNHYEVSWSSDSEVSIASTGKTYLMNNMKRMSYDITDTNECYADYEKTMRNERKYIPTTVTFISTDLPSRQKIDGSITSLVIQKTGETSRD